MENFWRILDRITSHPAFKAISFTLTLIAIVLAFYFYNKGKMIREPRWSIITANLIQNYDSKIADLKVLYKGGDIENLSISKIAIWNNGAMTILNTDIPQTHPLEIVGNENVRLLDVKLLAANNEANQFSATMASGGQSVFLNFDYLDKAQGAVVQIIHTGTSSDDLKLTGAVKGAQLPKKPTYVARYGTSIKSDAVSAVQYSKKIALLFLIASAMGLLVSIFFTSLKKQNLDWLL